MLKLQAIETAPDRLIMIPGRVLAEVDCELKPPTWASKRRIGARRDGLQTTLPSRPRRTGSGLWGHPGLPSARCKVELLNSPPHPSDRQGGPLRVFVGSRNITQRFRKTHPHPRQPEHVGPLLRIGDRIGAGQTLER